MNLIKDSILENNNLIKVPKVLVLQHCRGEEQIHIESDSSDEEFQTDGPVVERSHRMVSINSKLSEVHKSGNFCEIIAFRMIQ